MSTIVFCALFFGVATVAAEDNGDTPLMTAAYHGDVAAMRELIARGADLNATNRVGWTALHFAAGATPIRDQVYRGSPEAARLLLDKGADPNAAGKQGHRPLMLAAMNGNAETATLLLDHHADPNARTAIGDSALFQAVLRGKEDIVALLVARGADPNGRPFVNGDTLLLAAVAQAAKANFRDPERTAHGTSAELAKRRRIVHLLLEGKANVAVPNRAGHTALALAASNNQIALVRDLLGHGADPNARDRAFAGATPIMLAVRRSNRAMVTALVAAGADPGARDDRGTSALDLAQADPAIAAMLTSAGKSRK